MSAAEVEGLKEPAPANPSADAAGIAADIPGHIAEAAVEMTNRMFYEAGSSTFTASHMQWVYRENCKLMLREAELASTASSLLRREQALLRREGGGKGAGKGRPGGRRHRGRIPEANEFD